MEKSYKTRVTKLTKWLQDNRNKERDELYKYFSNSDLWKIDPIDMNTAERRELTMRRVADLVVNNIVAKSDQSMSVVNLLDGHTGTRLSIHYIFANCIKMNGTKEQIDYWDKKGAFSFKKFYGCAGFTELGHGSNVQGMETTLIFNKENDEFVLNTPHDAATKWWIGGAAHTANHSAVFARVVVNGKDYGVRPVVVKLRDTETHEFMPGVEIGDVGDKMGRHGVDNGWIKFSNVHVPRFNLLMKHISIDKYGNVEEKANKQTTYGALIGGRVGMARESYTCAAKYLTMTFKEVEITNFQALAPLISYAIAMKCGSQIDVEKMDPKTLFVTSAALKAANTWGAAWIIQQCLQLCPHTETAIRLVNGFDDWTVQCTWEGDNNILSLSAGSALIQNPPSLVSKPETLEYKNLIQAWDHVATMEISKAHEKFKGSNAGKKQRMEQLSLERAEIARLHTRAFLVKQFINSVNNFSDSDGVVKNALQNLAELFAVWSISWDKTAFIKAGFDLPKIDQRVQELTGQIPVVYFIESFNIPELYLT